MKTIGNLEFPENHVEAEDWTHTVRWVPLSINILCVAHNRIEGKWRAYIRTVPGVRHELELEPVLEWGTTIPEKIALAIFPLFKGIPYAK